MVIFSFHVGIEGRTVAARIRCTEWNDDYLDFLITSCGLLEDTRGGCQHFIGTQVFFVFWFDGLDDDVH